MKDEELLLAAMLAMEYSKVVTKSVDKFSSMQSTIDTVFESLIIFFASSIEGVRERTDLEPIDLNGIPARIEKYIKEMTPRER